MRRSGKTRINWRNVAAFGFSVLVVAAGAMTIWLTFRVIGAALFWENDSFAIRQIRVECPEVEVHHNHPIFGIPPVLLFPIHSNFSSSPSQLSD